MKKSISTGEKIVRKWCTLKDASGSSPHIHWYEDVHRPLAKAIDRAVRMAYRKGRENGRGKP